MTGTNPNQRAGAPAIIPPSFMTVSASFTNINGVLAPVFGTSAGQFAQGNTTVPTSRQVIAGTGLTGGGALSADVTLNVSASIVSGAAAGAGALQAAADLSDVASAPAALANLGGVPTGRQVASGTGLSGGGDLSADRTLSLAAIGTGTVLANTTGSTGVPTAVSISSIIGAAGASYSYQKPSTGFSITIPASTDVLALNPTGALLAGTVVMTASPTDGFIQRIASSQTITTLTISPNAGQTILDAPTTLSAGAGVAFIWIAPDSVWIRLY